MPQRRSRWSVMLAVSSFVASLCAAVWLVVALPARAGEVKKPQAAEVKNEEKAPPEATADQKPAPKKTAKKKKAPVKVDVGEFEGY